MSALGSLVKKDLIAFDHFWNKFLPIDCATTISRQPFYGSNIFTVMLVCTACLVVME